MKKLLILASVLLPLAVNAETVPGDQAKENGFKTCQNTVENISNFVINGNHHAALSTWNKKDTDNRLFNTLVSVNYTTGHSVAVANVAHGKSGKCDGNYTTVFYVDKSCSVARETTFKDWTYSGELAGLIVLKNESGGISKMLLPGGNGCVAISTEVAYQ